MYDVRCTVYDVWDKYKVRFPKYSGARTGEDLCVIYLKNRIENTTLTKIVLI